MECSGPQPTGCLFRSAVSALVARHAQVVGDPLQDNVGATSNKLVAHDDYFFNNVFSGRLIVQELCESRGVRPGLSVLTSLLVSVDVKNY